MRAMKTEYLDLPDIRIAYRQHGSGKPMLLLHGNSSNKAIFWKYQLKYFPEFHSFALDSRGHGQSQSSEEHLTYELISRDVIAFCHAADLSGVHVIGYSDGGNVGLILARDAPELFTQVVAISPNTLVTGMTEDSLVMIRKIHRTMTGLARIGIPINRYRKCFEMMLSDVGITDEELRSIQTSVKILYAENDMVREEHIQHIANLIPQVQLERIDGCSHVSIFNNKQTLTSIQHFFT